MWIGTWICARAKGHSWTAAECASEAVPVNAKGLPFLE
jgi:hypothetical protein